MDRIKFTQTNGPRSSRLEVGGCDLTRHAQAADFHVDVRSFPTAVVTLIAWEVECEFDGETVLMHKGCSHCTGHKPQELPQ